MSRIFSKQKEGWRGSWFSAVLIALAASGLVVKASGADIISSGLRYNDVRQKASHNSYQKREDVSVQLADYRIRSIEFDVHAYKPGLLKKEHAPDGDWLCYHTPLDDNTNCRLLSDCYLQVMAFHRAVPGHEVVTIFFDVEGLGDKGRTRADFYGLITRTFPKGSVFTPGEMMAACPGAKNLQEAVTDPGCAWPMLSELKGRFILVVSGGLKSFADGYDVSKDMVFLVSRSDDPACIHDDMNLVFFNVSKANPFTREVKKAGFVSRSYYLDSPGQFQQAIEFGAHHLATDKIDPDRYPWANTDDDQGRPFQVIGNGH